MGGRSQPPNKSNPSPDSRQERARQQCLFDWENAPYNVIDFWSRTPRELRPGMRLGILGNRLFLVK